jgi:hypothetical protein
MLGAGGAVSAGFFLAIIFGLIGYILPSFWLGSGPANAAADPAGAAQRAGHLTIGVQAGLSFESAMMRVSERWDNPLTRELRRTVVEMQVGVPRQQALRHLATRTNVPELQTFVAVLVQSSQLGVSVSAVLQSQAALMREKRRERADQAAREASIKMLFPLVFFIFPAVFVVIIGPALPQIGALFKAHGRRLRRAGPRQAQDDDGECALMANEHDYSGPGEARDPLGDPRYSGPWIACKWGLIGRAGGPWRPSANWPRTIRTAARSSTPCRRPCSARGGCRPGRQAAPLGGCRGARSASMPVSWHCWGCWP